MEVTLKPCPWCGGTPRLVEEPLRHYYGCSVYVIKCSKCGAIPPNGEFYDVYTIRDFAIQQAVEAWNTRNVGNNTTIYIQGEIPIYNLDV